MKKTKRKKHSIYFTALTVAGGAFVSVCYAFYLVSCFSQGNGFISILLPAAVIAAAVLSVYLHKKIHRVLAMILCAGMLFYTITFSVFFVYVNTTRDSFPEDGRFVAVVFGARTFGYMPGRSLATRLVRTLDLLNEYPEAVCVVSGGQGKNETIAEADAMKDFLIKRGIDGSRIFAERHSSDTIENINNSLDVISQNGLGGLPVVCVSSGYHLPRIRFLAARAGCDAYICASKSPSLFYLVSDSVREYMAWVKLGFSVAVGAA